jgi:hypothetical protein
MPRRIHRLPYDGQGREAVFQCDRQSLQPPVGNRCTMESILEAIGEDHKGRKRMPVPGVCSGSRLVDFHHIPAPSAGHRFPDPLHNPEGHRESAELDAARDLDLVGEPVLDLMTPRRELVSGRIHRSTHATRPLVWHIGHSEDTHRVSHRVRRSRLGHRPRPLPGGPSQSRVATGGLGRRESLGPTLWSHTDDLQRKTQRPRTAISAFFPYQSGRRNGPATVDFPWALPRLWVVSVEFAS